jgi:hypothetical protein
VGSGLKFFGYKAAKDTNYLNIGKYMLVLNCCGVSEPSRVIQRENELTVAVVAAVTPVYFVYGVLSTLFVNAWVVSGT